MTGFSLNTQLMIQTQILHKDCVKIKSNISKGKIHLINNDIDITHKYNKNCTEDIIKTLSKLFKTKFKYHASYPSHHIYGMDKNILKSKLIKSLINENCLKIIGAPMGKDLQITHHTNDEIIRISNQKKD